MLHSLKLFEKTLEDKRNLHAALRFNILKQKLNLVKNSISQTFLDIRKLKKNRIKIMYMLQSLIKIKHAKTCN